ELHEGVFSLVYGSGSEVGTALVKNPLIKAGGFTGSRAGGRALFEIAVSRPEPIPFYAEMSSVNPVVILPGALQERSDQIAAGLQGSVTLGAGQFCTNPGLVLLRDDEASHAFVSQLGELMLGSPGQTMLTPGICSTYQKGISSRVDYPGVETIAQSLAQRTGCEALAALFKTDAANFS